MPKYDIGIITVPISRSGFTPLSQLIEIIFPFTKKFSLITGDESYRFFKMDTRLNIVAVSQNDSSFFLMRIINYISLQLKITFWIIKNRKNIDILIFFIGGDILVIPMLIANILQKKTLMVVASSSFKAHKAQKDPFYKLIKITLFINYSCAKKIILYSTKLIEDYGLKIWEDKILIAHHHFIPIEFFTVIIPFSNRSPVIGYIGRISREKGVQNFVQALPSIIHDHPSDLHVIIGGEGLMKENIESFIITENLNRHVELPGWIPSDDFPKYLNKLRLLVLPSYSEGLPNIILEAMACGTPVLANAVGANTDLIQDGETGFLMKDNSPECIAENVLRALNSPDLEKISRNGRRFIQENFTFEKTLESYNRIFQEIE